MPQYHCLVQQNRWNAEQKSALAHAITAVHCEVTGAPRHFVHVFFHEIRDGNWFTAGEVSGFSIVNAYIRAGRTDPQKAELMSQISRRWSQITGQSERELVVTVTDLRPEHWMEAGYLMPQAGEEKDWLARLGLPFS
jgi:phenylpyruvate tautomerase PptA (4-oxalocrotonate tautomerase family)